MYRPPTKSSTTINGKAKITKAKKGEEKYFRVMLSQKDGDKITVTEMFFKPQNCPAYLAPGEWRVRISSDKTKVISAVPSEAIVVAEFSDIYHRENEDPTPSKKTTKFGDVFQFSWIWKVTEGEFEGVEVTQYLNYNFDAVDDGKGHDVVAYTHTASKYTEQLDNAITAAGVWNKGAIAWKENILPVLRKRAIREREENGLKVKLIITDGYVVAVKPLSAGWDEEDEAPAQPKPSDEVVEKEVETEVETEEKDGDIIWDTEDE